MHSWLMITLRFFKFVVPLLMFVSRSRQSSNPVSRIEDLRDDDEMFEDMEMTGRT